MKLIVFAGTVALNGVFMALSVMWLWNGTMPKLFHLQEIGFWMALKVSLLATVLFKSSSEVAAIKGD